MTYEQQSAIQKALLDEINNQYDVLDEQLLALAFTSAIETQRRIVELDQLRDYVLDLDPESATPENPDAPNEALIAAKESYDQRVSSSEPSERLVYDRTNTSAFVRMLLGI